MPGSDAAAEYQQVSKQAKPCVRDLVLLDYKLNAHAALIEDVQYDCKARCRSDSAASPNTREVTYGSACRVKKDCPRGQDCVFESLNAQKGRCAK